MFNHMPYGYVCPFCLVSKGIENQYVLTKQEDIIYKDSYITAFIAAGGWKNNKGHVIIIPNQHYENIYDLPNTLSAKIHSFEKDVAIAFKEVYKCDGVSSRQHNEPCGNQDVWHYHLHVLPRYKGDDLYKSEPEFLSFEERQFFAEKLKTYFLQKLNQLDIKIRLLNDTDIQFIEAWLKKDHVKKWYRNPNDWLDEISKRNDEFLFIKHFIVLKNEIPIGFCQYYTCLDANEDWYGDISLLGTYSIDYLIGEENYLGKGLGKGTIHLLVKEVFNLEDSKRIIVQPEEENRASCNSLLSNDFIFDEKNRVYCKIKK